MPQAAKRKISKILFPPSSALRCNRFFGEHNAFSSSHAQETFVEDEWDNQDEISLHPEYLLTDEERRACDMATD
jgi:hypothetical protein